MSLMLQSPQRPLPGAYMATPAHSRPQPAPSRLPLTRPTTSSLANARDVNPQQQSSSQAVVRSSGDGQATPRPSAPTLSPVERAAKTINDTLSQELRYPELDTYVGQGISSEYDIASSKSWAPFEKVSVHNIPDRIFEQYNHAQVSTMMGLFADLRHAWISIDNALYLWDYTQPDPELLGFEEQNSLIMAVRLVVPRPGVFVPAITRLLVIATMAEIILVGVGSERTPSGGQKLSLYQTKMSVPTKGLTVSVVEGTASGRIFFSGDTDNDIYEMTYQQEERWFHNRCTKINHTSSRLSTITPSFNFSAARGRVEHSVQLVADDSRQLLYSLSTDSTIRIFHIRPNGTLTLAIVKSFNQTLNDIGHMTSQTPLISNSMSIVSLSPISSTEATRLHLMATTSTGCRLFLSATSSYYGWSASDGTNAPTSLQVHHVKFPPPDTNAQSSGNSPNNASGQTTAAGSSQQLAAASTVSGINTSSYSLLATNKATRYAPGYFFCISCRDQSPVDKLFITAPDTGRIVRPQEANTLSRYSELGMWANLQSRAEAIGLVTDTFSAAPTPTGFANELAVQFDTPAPEIAVLTNIGVHTFRRQRLVDIFTNAIKLREGADGREGEARKFIRLYGRSETAATALAVACGQGSNRSMQSNLVRPAYATDNEVETFARKVFIDFGGKPLLNENTVVDQSAPSIDMVRPSPRHDGLALYISRLVRSFWKAPVAQESVSPTGGLAVQPSVSTDRLQAAQEALVRLKEFLAENKSFIDGLAGPEALRGVTTKQEEIALQAEHRALHSLVTLVSNIIEGISFVRTLFKERIEEIVLTLPNEQRQQMRNLTHEGLFCTVQGKELAKELVKAIVNRNIANGASVDTVADALRRQCGSFCSAEDVIVFKAQEQIRRAHETGNDSEFGRNLLNESLRLYKQVADSLPFEQLQWAVTQYVSAQFFAGAVELALNVAQQSDRGNRALSWIQDGRPEDDTRRDVFASRKRCYDLIHSVIVSLDGAAVGGSDVETFDLATKRRTEAYDVINSSEDEVFQTDLYDWYLSQGQANRLLDIQSPYIVTYLQRRSTQDVAIADLLWQYYAQSARPFEAAEVQLVLAKGDFTLPLDKRIEYLSRAKANASSYGSAAGRTSRQRLVHQISDLLDIANIQSDTLERLREEPRLVGDRRTNVLAELDGPIMSLGHLYNVYIDSAGYFDIALLSYAAASHSNPVDIRNTWRSLLEATHEAAVRNPSVRPYEAIADEVRRLGARLELSETIFPVNDLIPLLKRYELENQRGVGPETWVVDTFLDLGIAPETIYGVLEAMLYNDEAPFRGANRKYIANDMLHAAQAWFERTRRQGARATGGDAAAERMMEGLAAVAANGLSREKVEECQRLRMDIERLLR